MINEQALIEAHFMKHPKPRLNSENPKTPLAYIHPYAVEPIKQIISQAANIVDFIVVYGSAIGDYMKDNSDIDIAAVSSSPQAFASHVARLDTEREIDIKTFDSIHDIVQQAREFFPTPADIVRDGVVVYYKGHDIEVL